MAWAVELTVKLLEVEQGFGANKEEVKRIISHSPVVEKKTSLWDAYLAAQVKVDEFLNAFELQPKGN
jgi:hypothetical protein